MIALARARDNQLLTSGVWFLVVCSKQNRFGRAGFYANIDAALPQEQ
jgi:hypothetical protein